MAARATTETADATRRLGADRRQLRPRRESSGRSEVHAGWQAGVGKPGRRHSDRLDDPPQCRSVTLRCHGSRRAARNVLVRGPGPCLTSSTNGQASWIGNGWDCSPGFVERSYASCSDDAANESPKTSDECWSDDADTLTLPLNGRSDPLVHDDATGAWHPRCRGALPRRHFRRFVLSAGLPLEPGHTRRLSGESPVRAAGRQVRRHGGTAPPVEVLTLAVVHQHGEGADVFGGACRCVGRPPGACVHTGAYRFSRAPS